MLCAWVALEVQRQDVAASHADSKVEVAVAGHQSLVSVTPLACQPALSSRPTLAHQPPTSTTLVVPSSSPTDPFITAAGVLRSCMSWRSVPLRHGRSD